MYPFNNRNVKIVLIADMLITAILATVGWFWIGRKFGLLIIVAGFIFTIVQMVYAYVQYRDIARLSGTIDKVLHGSEQITISDTNEGELAVLQSEIYKMILRLKAQTSQLKEDKIYLADSLADVSHQLRTPLTSINLTVAMLAKDDVNDEQRLALTRELKHSLKRIDWLVEVLLKLSRLDAGMIELRQDKVEAKRLIKKACEPFYVLADVKGQKIITEVEDESFIGDLGWTCEALGNLIKNCIEHTPGGGEVSIKAFENTIFTEITVEDSGEGFAESDLKHIFERFYRGQNASGSSVGIGLALAQMIITAQNGTIKAENREDGGARFIIKFYKKLV